MMMIEKSTKITLNDYILTNIDLETLCFTIRLKDEKEYIVYHKKIKIDGRIKTINYIKKDDKIMLLDDEVTKLHLAEVSVYQREGI